MHAINKGPFGPLMNFHFTFDPIVTTLHKPCTCENILKIGKQCTWQLLQIGQKNYPTHQKKLNVVKS